MKARTLPLIFGGSSARGQPTTREQSPADGDSTCPSVQAPHDVPHLLFVMEFERLARFRKSLFVPPGLVFQHGQSCQQRVLDLFEPFVEFVKFIVPGRVDRMAFGELIRVAMRQG